MQIKNRKFIFVIIFIIYVVFLLLCFPTYSQIKLMSWDNSKDNIWIYIRNEVIFYELLFKFHKALRHKIPEWTMPILFIVNGINMFFGFKDYKKKWWYYIILLISILISVMIIDCWWILYTAE